MARFLPPALYLVAMFALNVYRAATQSFIVDEAYSYQLYVGREPFMLLRQYDANLHVLHTLLAWLSVKAFGLSELTFRLPSLAGCALYFIGVHRLSALFADSWRRLLAVVLLTANPLIEDHMSVARGYGLALGFFAWAFCEAYRALQGKPRFLALAVLLALSVASNFTFLFPSAGLAAATAGALVAWGRATLQEILRELAGPWLLLTFLMLVVPFSRMEPGAFYYGAGSLRESLELLARYSSGDHAVSGWLVISGAAVAVLGCLGVVWRRRKAAADSFPLLACGTLLLTLAAVAAAHVLFGVRYPRGRTGIYLLFLPALAMLPLARSRAGAAALMLASAAMAQGIRIDRYMEWRFDANTRDIIAQVASRHASSGGPVRVACPAPACRALQLYAVVRKLDWVEIRETPVWQPGFDYYVLIGDTEEQAARHGLRILYRGPVSGTVLAAPAGGRA